MSVDSKLRALFKINECPDRVTNVKRLALLFDELLYLPPETHPILNGEFRTDGRVLRRLMDGSTVEEEFNFFLHTLPGFTYADESIRDSELRETLAELREHKIARAVSLGDLDVVEPGEFHRIRNAFAAADMLDEEFNRLSESTISQYERIRITTIESLDQHGDKRVDRLVRAPNAIVDSYDITDVLGLAHSLRACPVFIDAHHRRELELRYDRASDIRLSQLSPTLNQSSFTRAAFGAVSFSLANEIFDSPAISSRSTKEIVHYRSRMEDARVKYVSSDLMELTQLVESQPWGPKVQDEVERYLLGKMKRDLAAYSQATGEIWEKMFGALSIGLFKAARTGAVGGVVGKLLPHASLWEMAAAGAVAGLAKEIPEMAQVVVDSILAIRSQRRNAIAYLAEFN
jgi:hypothetical protein